MSNKTRSPSEELLPPYLPPRRPKSLPNLTRSRTSWHISSANVPALPEPGLAAKRSVSRPRKKLTKQRQLQEAERTTAPAAPAAEEIKSRPTSYQSFSSGDTAAFQETSVGRHSSTSSNRSSRKGQQVDKDLPSHDIQSSTTNGEGQHSSSVSARSSYEGQQRENRSLARTLSGLASIPDGLPLKTRFAAPTPVRVGARPSVLRKSSLRIETRLSDEDMAIAQPPPALSGSSYYDPQSHRGRVRPYSHPASKSKERVDHESPLPPFSRTEEYPWQPTSLSSSRRSTPSSQKEPLPKPRASLKRLSSLDHFLSWQEEKTEWKRNSSSYQQASSEPSINDQSAKQSRAYNTAEQSTRPSGEYEAGAGAEAPIESEKQHSNAQLDQAASEAPSEIGEERERPVFRHPSAEYGFIVTVAIMQLLSEYLITGFAMELPTLLDGRLSSDGGAMGLFWPAVLLTLIMGSTLLSFARVSDIYGGYPCFMFGTIWLTIWTVVPGCSHSVVLLDVARAMQGLAIAAYTPSTFAMIGALYPEGPRRNVVMGIVAGCAPLGFFAGFLVAGALPEDKTSFYFRSASIVSFVMFWVAFLSVPKDKTDRSELQLHMDWIGAGLITTGLVLLAFALSVEPYAGQPESERTGFSFPICYAPFAAGIACLLVAFWYEGWKAECPLLPLDFFTPKSVKTLALACLCFYGSYGVWLYNSAEFFRSPSGVSKPASSEDAISGINLALWYAPTAIGGIILCVCSSAILHIAPITLLLLLSAFAWVGAPLFLALAPLPLHYWSFVLPSMLCATVGLDLTYTVSLIYGASVQPLKYQGLSGAVASSLINLGMSFALPISEIAMKRAKESVEVPAGDMIAEHKSMNWGYRAAFFYGAASAGLGLVVCALFVRIPRGAVNTRPAEEERPRAAMSEATLVGEGDERAAALDSERSSQLNRDSV